MAELFNGLQRVLGTSLAFFYDLIPSFGVSIILLTLGVNLLLSPLTLRQSRATRAFQTIQPEIRRIQEEHRDDKELMQKELMEAQKEAGATPAGCLLPMLVQLPIWLALFRVFRNVAQIAQGTADVVPLIPQDSHLLAAIKAGKTQFMGMGLGQTMSEGILAGLPGALPYLLFLVMMIGAQYTQQWHARRNQPESGNKKGRSGNTQQAITRIMPLFIGFISWRFPAGLVLYWTTSNIVRLAQQFLLFRLDQPRKQPSVESSSSSSDPDEQSQGEHPERRTPHPVSKKKRRRRRR